MGVSIHYSGQLKNPSLLPTLVEEVIDICKIFNWPYHCFYNKYPNDRFESADNGNDYGLLFTPKNCEIVSLVFDAAGFIYAPWLKQFFTDKSFAYLIHTKTQFAGAEVHTQVIELLDYLNKKYFQCFELIDEGEYWEKRDKNLLKGKINFLGDKINMLADGLENTERMDNENWEDFIKRIAGKI